MNSIRKFLASSKLVVRCLRKDAERRPQHMADINLALEELKEDSNQQRGEPLVQQSPRRLLWIAAAAGILASLWSPGCSCPGRLPKKTYDKDPSIDDLCQDRAESRDSTRRSASALSWNGEKEDNFDMYVKLVDAGTPLRLSSNPAADSAPACSPDGRFIAFVRDGSEAGYYIVPAVGGSERKILGIPLIPSTLADVAHVLSMRRKLDRFLFHSSCGRTER